MSTGFKKDGEKNAIEEEETGRVKFQYFKHTKRREEY